MSAITKQLATFAANLTVQDIPSEVTARASALVLDQIGIAWRARQEADLAGPAAEGLAALGLGAGNCTVFGDTLSYGPLGAAFFNGNLGHSLDFDDTHAAGSIHPSAPIVSAALAAGESVGASGADVIAGIVAGYEIQIRLSLALNPTEHYQRGFHPTATCGVFGAAAAVGRVLGMDAAGIHRALGLCCSQAAGSMQFLVDGSWNKPFHVGWAAMGGLTAANMAKAGYQGAIEGIEGKAGFLNNYAPNPNPELAVKALGSHWETMAIAVKPYPSCRYGHAAMDALIALRKDQGLRAADVESITIGLPKTGMSIIGGPTAEKQNPKNYVDGQFSMSFVGAVALLDGTMTWDSYANRLADPETLALCQRIRCANDADIEAEFPRYMAGSATVKTHSGKTLVQTTIIAKGEPENFLSEAELRAKFDGLTSPWLDLSARDALVARALELPRLSDVRDLMMLGKATQPMLSAVSSGSDD